MRYEDEDEDEYENQERGLGRKKKRKGLKRPEDGRPKIWNTPCDSVFSFFENAFITIVLL